MNIDQDIEFMDRVTLKNEIRKLRAQERQITEAIQIWVDQQGHNRCWYYPELFYKLVQLLGIKPKVEPSLPPLQEFKAGCTRYQNLEYNIKEETDTNLFEDYE